MQPLTLTVCVLVFLMQMSESRVYEPCRFAKELHYVYGIPREQIPYSKHPYLFIDKSIEKFPSSSPGVLGVIQLSAAHRLCYVDHWSAYNTSTIGVPEGMLFFGLFQFSNRISCTDPNRPDLTEKKRCNLLCSALTDDSIMDDVKCILDDMRHKGETTRSSFMAEKKCEDHPNLNMFIHGCNI